MTALLAALNVMLVCALLATIYGCHRRTRRVRLAARLAVIDAVHKTTDLVEWVRTLNSAQDRIESAQRGLEESLRGTDPFRDAIAMVQETTDEPTAGGSFQQWQVGDLRVTIDHEALAVSVARADCGYAGTEVLGEGFLIDRDDDGKVCAVEVLAGAAP